MWLRPAQAGRTKVQAPSLRRPSAISQRRSLEDGAEWPGRPVAVRIFVHVLAFSAGRAGDATAGALVAEWSRVISVSPLSSATVTRREPSRQTSPAMTDDISHMVLRAKSSRIRSCSRAHYALNDTHAQCPGWVNAAGWAASRKGTLVAGGSVGSGPPELAEERTMRMSAVGVEPASGSD